MSIFLGILAGQVGQTETGSRHIVVEGQISCSSVISNQVKKLWNNF
jgi:hypothetical protein